MAYRTRWTLGLGRASGLAIVAATLVGALSCGTAPTAFLVRGPGQFGNDPPSLTITQPNANITRGQGDPFLITWEDSDRDDNASIRFALLSTVSNSLIVLVDGLSENDDSLSASSHTVNTALIPVGTYNLVGTISDDTTSVDVFAQTSGPTPQRAVISVVPAGSGPQTQPPQIVVTQPLVNLSMAQDDELLISVQSVATAPGAPAPTAPFDPDSTVTIYIVLDTDLNPNNDDPGNPDPTQLILLDQRTVAAGATATDPFRVTIDLATSPPRPGGEAYYIRATIDDGTNPRVHGYAIGTINIVQLASASVDLADMGRTVSGVRWYGFSPGANTGSKVTALGDFDEDGLDDFLFVAQFGNPQNAGPVGEAYLVYGRNRLRFGGAIPVNSIAQTVSGVVFHAPPIRDRFLGFTPGSFFARTDGITDVGFVPDLTNDGRPELLFGLSHVYGAWDSTDYDPDDQDPTDAGAAGCYPDPLVNNFADQPDRQLGVADSGFYAGGMAVMVNSQNRDNDPAIVNPPATRLESTAISLELAGQLPVPLDSGGFDVNGDIRSRADNSTTADIGNDPQEPRRISGARFIGGGFDHVSSKFAFDPDTFLPLIPDAYRAFYAEAAREDLFGHDVGFVGDLNADGLPEIVISAPRNERFLTDLQTSSAFFSPQFESTLFFRSIMVFPGTNYNDEFWRDLNDESGTSITPSVDHQHFRPFGGCDPAVPRHQFTIAGVFEIAAENIDDLLGDGQSAGDFNQDGIDDILCGAPLNNRSNSLKDTGATYILYGRNVFGDVDLENANDPIRRAPMLRIRGVTRGDQIGWRQSAGLDVNGDRVDDVFLSTPHADYGDVERATCAGDFDRSGTITAADLRETSFLDCRLDFGDEVFTSDACKVFDYDNDGDIDEVDRCVFCCLSDDCDPEATCNVPASGDCCAGLADNGFAAVIFGGRFTDGDRDITQIATSDLPGTIFFGGHALDRAGIDMNSAGDFNHDGFGDILIAAPGEIRRDSAGRQRVGVVYLVFGGTHLTNAIWNLSDPERGVGSSALPGIVFLSPYVMGRPNEAAPVTVGLVGDINNDGFDDIFVGNPKADFIDLSFPQGPDAPGSDAAAGRRRNAGDAYIVYGNNFGSNRLGP